MGRPCLTCTHPSRKAIEEAVVSGMPVPAVAERYGFHPDAIRRHAERHIPPTLVRAVERKSDRAADTLLTRVESLIARAERVADEAEAEGDRRDLLAAIRELGRLLELFGKVTGEIDTATINSTTINVLMTQEWLDLRELMFAALSPYPSARKAVAEAVLALEPPAEPAQDAQ